MTVRTLLRGSCGVFLSSRKRFVLIALHLRLIYALNKSYLVKLSLFW